MNFNCLLFLLPIAIESTAVETNSRWTSIMPVNVTNHGNMSIRRRDLHDFGFNANLSIYDTFGVDNKYSTESHSAINPDTLLNENPILSRMSLSALRRVRRSERKWIESFATVSPDVVKMHAFIVKDEEIPDCGTVAQLLTRTRYYICSGSVLTEKHVLTSATCMNKAVFHDYHIHAEVGVLVGDLAQNNYVMKVLDYAMHPKYDPNPASRVHEINNLAVMSLACQIPDGKVVLPRLPLQKFDDLAHVCCTNKCSISSVFRLAHNRYVLQTMAAKHIPSFDKVHGKDFTILTKRDTGNNNKESFNENPLLVRRIRDSKKTFISQFYIKKIIDQVNKNKSQEIQKSTLLNERATIQSEIKRKRRSSKLLSRLDRDTLEKKEDSQRVVDSPSHWSEIVQEINTGKVSEKSQDEMTNFLKNTMTDLLEKIVKVLSTHVGNIANAYPYFVKAVNSENVTKTVEQSLMSYLTETVKTDNFFKEEARDDGNTSNEPGGKSNKDQASPDSSLQGKSTMRSMDTIFERNREKIEFFCPSIGTPIIQNNTVFGLIVYTCDEVQNWVAWKYVETIHNTEWIRKQIEVVNYEKVDEKSVHS